MINILLWENINELGIVATDFCLRQGCVSFFSQSIVNELNKINVIHDIILLYILVYLNLLKFSLSLSLSLLIHLCLYSRLCIPHSGRVSFLHFLLHFALSSKSSSKTQSVIIEYYSLMANCTLLPIFTLFLIKIFTIR